MLISDGVGPVACGQCHAAGPDRDTSQPTIPRTAGILEGSENTLSRDGRALAEHAVADEPIPRLPGDRKSRGGGRRARPGGHAECNEGQFGAIMVFVPYDN